MKQGCFKAHTTTFVLCIIMNRSVNGAVRSFRFEAERRRDEPKKTEEKIIDNRELFISSSSNFQ